MTRIFIAIFLGGGLGSIMRYGVQMLVHERIMPYHFPWATFTVNITGSLLIGIFYALSARFNISDELRLFLTAGLCGGFTTFSTFSNDSIEMISNGHSVMCIIYITLSIIVGVLACFLGGWLASPR